LKHAPPDLKRLLWVDLAHLHIVLSRSDYPAKPPRTTAAFVPADDGRVRTDGLSPVPEEDALPVQHVSGFDARKAPQRMATGTLSR